MAAVSAVLAALAVAGCGNRNAEVERLMAERDSLLRSLETQSVEFDNYEQTVGILNATLDSISELENLIFLNTGEPPFSKEALKYNLMRFETVLDEQSEKIRQLEERLALSVYEAYSALEGADRGKERRDCKAEGGARTEKCRYREITRTGCFAECAYRRT